MTLVIDLCYRDLSRSEFVQPISTIVGKGARVKHFSDIEPEEVTAAKAVVICGTALADDDYLEHMDVFDWLALTSTPVLGICAGMQLMALHNGARLIDGKEVGMTLIEPVQENPLVTEPLKVYGLHRHGLSDLDQFHVLATSEGCVQAIAHRERPLYGVMFHPEVRRGNVVSRFLDLYSGRDED